MRELWNKTGAASIWRIIKIELNKAIVSWAFVGNYACECKYYANIKQRG